MPGVLSTYIYIIMDAQLNVQNGAYIFALYQKKADDASTSYGAVCGSDWGWKNTFSLEFTLAGVL